MKIKRLALILSILSVPSLMACGSGSDGESSSSGSSLLSGQFVDEPVENLAYSTASQSNKYTAADGTFYYSQGETVTFKVGDLTIGSAPGNSTVTPIDLVSGGTSDDTEVLNIARFLQSLDDGTSSGKIVIPDNVHTQLKSSNSAVSSDLQGMDFSSTSFDTTAGNILSVVTADYGSGPASLKSRSAAKSEMETYLNSKGIALSCSSKDASGTWTGTFVDRLRSGGHASGMCQ